MQKPTLPPIPMIPKVQFEVQAVTERIDWGLKALNVPAVWSQTKGKGVIVAIVDTGIDKTHPDLVGAVIAEKSFVPGEGPEDGNGHGTHVAGTVAARANNLGVIGVAPEVSLINAKVMNRNGEGSMSAIKEAIGWCITQGADIISMSLGGSEGYDPLYRSLRNALARGIMIIAAAGNEGSERVDTVGFPGAYDFVVTVGALDPNLTPADYSSVGRALDIAAPGSRVLSTIPGGKYAIYSGTSMATPFVAGVTALALAKHRISGGQTPLTHNWQLKEHLQATAKDFGPPGHDPKTGWGIIDPMKMIR